MDKSLLLLKLISVALIGTGSYILFRPIIFVTKPQASPIQKESDFRAVTSLNSSEKFYLETRRSNDLPKYVLEEELKVKEDICTSISSSTFFSDVLGLHPLHPNTTEVREYVARHSLNVFENHIWIDSRLRSSKFINPYTLRWISVSHNIEVQEFVFICLAGKLVSDDSEKNSDYIVHYYVSREYELAGWSSDLSYTKGRFVFSLRKNRPEEIVPIAIADKPAQTMKYFIEDQYHYDKLKEIFKSRETWPRSDSMLCDLKAFTKTRLCTIILSADVYRKNFRFSPFWNNTDVSCKRVSYTVNVPGQGNLSITDWMLECEAVNIGYETNVNFDVSYGRTIRELIVRRGKNGSTKGWNERLSL